MGSEMCIRDRERNPWVVFGNMELAHCLIAVECHVEARAIAEKCRELLLENFDFGHPFLVDLSHIISECDDII